MKEFGTNRWATVWNWEKRYGLHLIRLPNGKPAIMKDQIKMFILRYDKRHHKVTPE